MVINYPKVRNGGIALAFGHGLGNGACGTVSLIQNQLTSIGKEIEGHTIINYQIGTRSFSGEITDSFNLKNGKLDSSTAFYLINSRDPPSGECSQPIFKNIEHEKFTKLLEIVANSIKNDTSVSNECIKSPSTPKEIETKQIITINESDKQTIKNKFF